MSRTGGLRSNLQVWRGHLDTRLSWASCSGPYTATQFFASSLPSLFSVYTELIAKDASCNFLWETLVRDGLNDTPRMRSRWWENKRQDEEDAKVYPPPSCFSHSPLVFFLYFIVTWFLIIKHCERLNSEPLTIVSRPMGAEKTHSSWKTTASAWWLGSRSSKLLRRPSVCGSGGANELHWWRTAVVRELKRRTAVIAENCHMRWSCFQKCHRFNWPEWKSLDKIMFSAGNSQIQPITL